MRLPRGQHLLRGVRIVGGTETDLSPEQASASAAEGRDHAVVAEDRIAELRRSLENADHVRSEGTDRFLDAPRVLDRDERDIALDDLRRGLAARKGERI